MHPIPLIKAAPRWCGRANEEGTDMRRRALVLLAVILLVAGCGKPKMPERPPPQAPPPSRPAAEPKPVPKPKPAPPADEKPVEYQILPGERGDKDVSFDFRALGRGAAKRYTRDITVPYETTDEEVKATLRAALKDLQDLHPDAGALMVRLFFEGGTAVAHARVTWAPGGEWARAAEGGTKSISFASPTPRPPKPVTGDRFGLSLAKRKEIFVALGAAEDKAWEDADAEHPYDVHKQNELVDKLASKYKAQVRKKYGLTEEQEDAIDLEGCEQSWEW